MKFLKGFFIASVISIATSAVVLALIFKFYLEPNLKAKIEAQSGESLGGLMTIGTLDVRFYPDISIELGSVRWTFSEPRMQVEVLSIRAAIPLSPNLLTRPQNLGPLEILIKSPKLRWTATEPKPNSAPPPSTESVSITPPLGIDLKAKIQVIDGDFIFEIPTTLGINRQLKIQPFNLEFDLPSLQQDWTLKTHAVVNLVKGWPVNFAFPVDLSAKLGLTGSLVKAQESQISMGGIQLGMQGQHNLQTMKGNWTFKLSVPAVDKLNVPPALLPPGKWTGGIFAEGWATNQSSPKWNFSGSFDLKNLTGETQFQNSGLSVDGSVSANLHTQFSGELGTWYRVMNTQISTQLTNANVDYTLDSQKIFTKGKGVPLAFEFKGQAENTKIQIENIKLQLANAHLGSSGDVQISPAGSLINLKVALAKTNLSGWEKMLPQLANSPLIGNIEMNAAIKGPLEKTENLEVLLNPLQVQNVASKIQWQSADKKRQLQGRFLVDGRAQAQIVGGRLEQADLKLRADLSDMNILWDDLFRKKPQQNLKLDVIGSSDKGKMKISSSSLSFANSRLGISGLITNPMQPELDLRLNIERMALGEIFAAIPAASTHAMAGSAQGHLQLTGTYDFKLGLQSPLTVLGRLALQVPEYKFAPKPEAKPTTTGTATTPPSPEPILPNWPLLKTSVLQLKLAVQRFWFKDLPVNGIQSDLSYNRGNIQARGNIGQIFGGSVMGFEGSLSGLIPNPAIQASLNFRNINLNHAATWMSPDWRDLVKGQATGQAKGTAPLPGSLQFLKRIQAQAHLQVANAYLSTLPLDQIVNDQIARIPGVGTGKTVASKGVNAEVVADVEMLDGIMHIKGFRFLTPEKNELHASGSLDLTTKNIDLDARAMLSNVPVGGSLRAANSDPQGRLILPVRFSGPIAKMNASIAGDTISTLVQKTAEYETKKATQSAAAAVKNRVQEEANKKAEELKERLKNDALKSILGR